MKTRSLLFAGTLSAAVYLLALLFYSNPVLAESRLAQELFIWPAIGLLAWAYFLGARALKTSPPKFPTRRVWLFAMGFLLLCILLPPFHSTDLFGYINRGWQQVHYGMNPYVFVVDDIPHRKLDPMLTNHWVDNPCPYGFFFALWAKAITAISFGSKWMAVILFKLTNSIVHILIGLLIYHMARLTNSTRPEYASYLYLWNPLILLNQIANGHNDLLMAFFTLLALWLVCSKKVLAAVPAMITGTFIKYAPLVSGPAMTLYSARTFGPWKTGLALLLGVATAAIWASPYLPDWQHFRLDDMAENAAVAHGSFQAMIFHFFRVLVKIFPALDPYSDTVRQALKVLFFGGFGVFLLAHLAYLWRTWKNPQPESLIFHTLLPQFLLVCLVSSKYYPWYIGMFFPLVCLLDEKRWLRHYVLIISITQLLSMTFIGQSHMINFILIMVLPVIYLLKRRKKPEDKPLEASTSIAAGGDVCNA